MCMQLHHCTLNQASWWCPEHDGNPPPPPLQAHVRRKLEGWPPERTAYLLGEGLGALVALAVAAQCRCGPAGWDTTNSIRATHSHAPPCLAHPAAGLPPQPHTCREVNRLVLINPASSYPGSNLAAAAPLLDRLPARLCHTVAAAALSPLLSDPLRSVAGALAAHLHGSGTARQRQQAVQALLPELRALVSSLPPQALAWRLQLMASAAT